MDEFDRTFIRGNRNPERYGFSIRATLGVGPDDAAIEHAASILERERFYVDKQGYECELIAAAYHPPTSRLAYLETRAKRRRWTSMVDVSIKVHLRDISGKDSSVDIKSYNPFFGCDVGFLQWVDDTSVLIYTEKHDTYVCAFGTQWPPQFIAIEERWLIKDDVLTYIGYEQAVVQRRSIPDLTLLDPIQVSEAEQMGILPPDPYTS